MREMLTTAQAALEFGMSKSWLEKMRYLGPGHGPRYIKVGRSIRYKKTDLMDYFQRRSVG